MKICRISTVPYQIHVFLKTQIAETIKSGHEVTIITSPDQGVSNFCDQVGARYIPLKMERRISPFRDLVALILLVKIFIFNRFDVVHSISSKAGFLTSIAALLTLIPVRLHVFAGLPWECMKGSKRVVAIFCDRLIVLLNTKCYADSNSEANVLYQHGIAKQGAIRVLGHGSVAGVDLDRFNPKNQRLKNDDLRLVLDIDTNAPIILFIGRVTRDKGIKELVYAFIKARETVSNLHLVIVGPFDTAVEPIGTDLIKLINETRNIFYVGEDYEPEKYLAICDFLVIPSYREGFCNVVIEAAAMGKPSIGSRVTGLVDSIIDEKTGILVTVKSVDQLVYAIVRLLNNESLKLEMGLKARSRAINSFNQHYINKLVIDEYKEVG